MDDVERTFRKLQKADLATVRRLIFEKSRAPGEDNGFVWLDDWNGSLKRFNPIYIQIITDNGWELQEFLDEIYKNDNK